MKTQLKRFRNALFFLGISGMLLTSCQTQMAPGSDAEVPPYQMSKNADANLELVNNYAEALISADGAVLKSSVSNNFMSFGPANDSATIDQVVEQWTTIASERTDQDLGIFASNSLTVNEGPFPGEWVSLWGTYTAKDNATGYEYQIPWHGAYFLEEGKISLSRGWFDNLAPALGIGAVVPAEEEQ